nr:histidine kinase dimerization/phospho-acceptor domain-containing protein [Paenibacillus darwinianus]
MPCFSHSRRTAWRRKFRRPSVSHEFQSPLTSIIGFTKALKDKKMSKERRVRYLTTQNRNRPGAAVVRKAD